MLSLEITVSGQELLWITAALSLTTLFMIALLRKYFHARAGREMTSNEKHQIASERNKYREVNVFRFRGTFLQFGLILSLGMAVLAFAWTWTDANRTFQAGAYEVLPDILVVPPATEPEKPKPKIPPPTVLEEVPDEEILEDEVPEFVDLAITENQAIIAPEPEVEATPLPLPMPEEDDGAPDEIFKIVEEMPRFPGCDGLATKDERKQCSDRELFKFLSKNIKYPAIARENGIEGTAVITFVVEKNGTITDARITRAPGGGLGEEALRVVELMNKEGLTWTPGRQLNQPVRVQFNLPVRFKLQ